MAPVRNCKPISVLKTGQSTKNHLTVTILDLGQTSYSDNEDQKSFLSSQSGADGAELATPTPEGEGDRRGSQTSQKENLYGKRDLF